jgi:hypothetical protein
MSTGVAKDLYLAIVVPTQNQGTPDHGPTPEVVGLGYLGLVSDIDPVGAENAVAFPVEDPLLDEAPPVDAEQPGLGIVVDEVVHLVVCFCKDH